MPRITEQGKIKEGRGHGTGANYKPWIKIRELNSQGTASAVIDYKHGREIQLLSQGEVYYYYMLRWRDDVADIREQYPLELDLTIDICDKLGYKHPKNEQTRMTTDLLVTKDDGTLQAYSVKNDESALNDARTVEKLYVEKLYWKSLNVPYKIVFKSEVNKTFVKNIMDVVSCYDLKSVQDIQGLIRHKIAHKEMIVDMETAPLDYAALTIKF